MSDSVTIGGDLASLSPTLVRLVAEGKISERVARTIPGPAAKILQQYTMPDDAPERLREFRVLPLRRFFNPNRVALPPDLEPCFMDDGGFGAFVCGAIRKAVGHWHMSQDAALDMTMAEYDARLDAEEETAHEHRLLLRDEIGKALKRERQPVSAAQAPKATAAGEVLDALRELPDGWKNWKAGRIRQALVKVMGRTVGNDTFSKALQKARAPN
jgi:hypothetical protein